MMRCIPSSMPSSRPSPSPRALGASGAISASSGAPAKMEMTARCLDWEQGQACGLQGCHPATSALPSSPAWALRNRILWDRRTGGRTHLLLSRAIGPALRGLALWLSLPLICVHRVAGEPYLALSRGSEWGAWHEPSLQI